MVASETARHCSRDPATNTQHCRSPHSDVESDAPATIRVSVSAREGLMVWFEPSTPLRQRNAHKQPRRTSEAERERPGPTGQREHSSPDGEWNAPFALTRLSDGCHGQQIFPSV